MELEHMLEVLEKMIDGVPKWKKKKTTDLMIFKYLILKVYNATDLDVHFVQEHLDKCWNV